MVGRAILCPPLHLQFRCAGSVEIRFGERKRVFDQFDAGFGVVRNNDFNNVESKEDIRIIQHSEPGQRPAGNSLSFFSIDRFEGPTEIFATAGLYFDKNQRVVITTDNIDLAANAASEIAKENFVTITLEIAARQVLAQRTSSKMIRPG